MRIFFSDASNLMARASSTSHTTQLVGPLLRTYPYRQRQWQPTGRMDRRTAEHLIGQGCVMGIVHVLSGRFKAECPGRVGEWAWPSRRSCRLTRQTWRKSSPTPSLTSYSQAPTTFLPWQHSRPQSLLTKLSLPASSGAWDIARA